MNRFFYLCMSLCFLFFCFCESKERIPVVSGEEILDPEVIPEQDGDPYPGESVTRTFAVSGLFSNNMVVQQNRQLRVWGAGTTGQTVRVEVSWSSQTFISKVNGRGFWRVRLHVPPIPAGNPEQTIKVFCGHVTRTYTGVLIGEVWFCSGQSNMQMTLRTDGLGGHPGVEDQEAVIAASGVYSNKMRVYTGNLLSHAEPQWNCSGSGWKICNPDNAGNFSATAYFFGKYLVDNLDIPVGLVVSSYGGAPAQSFVPLAALETDPILKAKFYTPYINNPSGYAPPGIPGQLYNAMVYPFFNLSLRGTIWYQGESNWQQPDTYPLLIKTMMTEWRRGFAQGDIPHYYVQLTASYMGINCTDPEQITARKAMWDWYAYIREGQAKVHDQVSNSRMAVTLDVGDPDEIHPMKKREVGERLGRIALNRNYGKANLNYYGPRYKSHKIEGNKVIVTFDYANGLRTNDGLAPRFFYLAGSGKVFYNADAVINGNTVELTSASVSTPVSVRYALITAPVTNLENSDGLPAECFRTDSWDPVNEYQSTVTYSDEGKVVIPPYY